jgi:hypothetical protein
MDNPAPRQGEIRLGRVQLPVGLVKRGRITAVNRPLVKQPAPLDPLIHAANPPRLTGTFLTERGARRTGPAAAPKPR